MDISDAVRALDRDLRDIAGARLESVVAYGAPVPGAAHTRTLAVVRSLSAADLRACAARVAAWREQGLSTPLLLATHEFGRSLDVFPFEFGAILADYAVVSGEDPFRGLTVDSADLRHACEVQGRGLLLHLREGYIETEGRSDRLVDLLQRSANALGPLLTNVARLVGHAGTDPAAAAAAIERHLGLENTGLAEIVSSTEGRPLTADAARRIFPTYLNALDRLTAMVDTWAAG
jgi:hypothetical protein